MTFIIAMGSPSIWYKYFLDNQIVPPPNSHFLEQDRETDFYALKILSFNFKEVFFY